MDGPPPGPLADTLELAWLSAAAAGGVGPALVMAAAAAAAAAGGPPASPQSKSRLFMVSSNAGWSDDT